MANLFWKTKSGVGSLLATPFNTEEEFEKIIFDTPEILEDIFPLTRQVRGGNKAGIPDILGIDSDGNICIVEMKNVNVDASIIPQVLQYAFWAETNPDSIKSLWLECKNKPEDISISWDKVQVRIIILAPSILRSTLDIVDKISYPVDLIEVKRWMEKDNQFILVNQLEREITTKHIKPTGGLKQYNEAFYREEYNRQSAGEFIRVTNEIEKLVKKQGWSLEKKYNKHYCGYKAGFFNAFGVQWVGSKTFALFFKLPEKEAKGLNPRMTKYQSLWKQALYYIEPKKFRINDYLGLFKAAYKHLTSE